MAATAVLEAKVRADIAAFLARQGKVRRQLAKPTAQGVRDFVRALSRLIARLNTTARIEEGDALAIRNGVLHDAFLPLLFFRLGRTEDSATLLAARWLAHLPERPGRRVTFRIQPVAVDGREAQRLLEVFNAAVTEALLDSTRDLRARVTIRRLMVSLRLSYDDLGRMLAVSGETVRRWANGAVQMPEDKMATLDTFGSALAVLLHLFRPDRLQEVIRRPADAFGGQRALDWILQGRLRDVAEAYDRLLHYQA